MVSDTAYSRKTAINGKLRPFCRILVSVRPFSSYRKIVYFDHIATFIFYGIRYHPNHKKACIGLYRFILGIPARTMPEHIALQVRQIIKNRLNADLRQVD